MEKIEYIYIADHGDSESGEIRVSAWSDMTLDLTVYKDSKSLKADMTVQTARDLIAALQAAVDAVELKQAKESREAAHELARAAMRKEIAKWSYVDRIGGQQ